MSDIKFACPACQQHISADQGYAGMEIACPACSARMVVPGTPAPVSIPAPVPAPAYIPPPPAPSAVAAPSAATGGCPSCGSPMARGAVICTQCGYNLATKQRIVAGRVVAPGKPVVHADVQDPWYKTPFPYVLVLLAIFGTLFFLGKSNPPMMALLVGLLFVYFVVIHIIVTVFAFKESVGTGFLTLCFPIYGLYFVFSVSENQWLKTFYPIGYLGWIGVRVAHSIMD
jgi:DNA-directed RNA polymerase subunit RPC12/RpoP